MNKGGRKTLQYREPLRKGLRVVFAMCKGSLHEAKLKRPAGFIKGHTPGNLSSCNSQTR